MATSCLPFRFFDLPPELRDWVFDSLRTSEEAVQLNESSLKLFVENRLQTSCLVVSKQFNQEYRDRCAKRQKLIFKDYDHYGDWSIPADAPPIPGPLRPAIHCSFIVMAFERGSDLRDHPRWILDALSKLPRVKDAEITAYLQFDEPRKHLKSLEGRVKHDLQKLVETTGVKFLRLFTTHNDADYYDNLGQVLDQECCFIGSYWRDGSWTEATNDKPQNGGAKDCETTLPADPRTSASILSILN